MNKCQPSTFEREMQDPAFKTLFKKAYQEFLLSEFILALMEKDKKSVRQLADEVDISHAFGYHLVLEKGNERIPLS